jgi:hypothetical protein
MESDSKTYWIMYMTWTLEITWIVRILILN